ncbi:isochorismatase family protein [Ideonella azotifigens]|uniref:Cysteine hydrolase family protein n=1 Tax=Ideonella azotifigens TaxID=513160 RepID=A0ABN1KBR2_9BURK|nr:isochorismatase family protein [Ideonella azotifigens]MCD2344112.1 isochorismatase family protein [Ideonella azotifigens]
MATVREGSRSILLVVDVQVGVVRNAWQPVPVVAQVQRAVERARAAGAPVLWVQHHNQEMPRDSADWQWAPGLAPAQGETRIHKQWNSAFEDTPLDGELARLGATHIVLAGASSNWCIRATAYAALDHGYDLTLVSDAHTTDSMTLEDGSVIEAAMVIRELNIAMRWLEYPGRKNHAVPAEELVF